MRQILCVIDFSDSSAKVLDVATRMASAWKAHLLILFPYRLLTDGYQGNLAALRLKLETEARQKFQDLKEKLPPPGIDNLSCEFQPEIGFISDRIKAHVTRDKEAIDMIIVGQDQTESINDSRGLNLQSLITNSKLPFVIVPSEVKAEASVL